MAYSLLYHPLVARDDIPAIPRNLQRRLARAIEARLSTEPQRYGEPLRGPFQGYRKLRVGDYRVVYRIVKQEVWILAISSDRRPREGGAIIVPARGEGLRPPRFRQR